MKITREQFRDIAAQAKRFNLTGPQIARLAGQEYGVEITRHGAWRRFKRFINRNSQPPGNITEKAID
jgi:hypothetical protein